jgi:ABC-type multidrug transport system fused ATPase/permease subunit
LDESTSALDPASEAEAIWTLRQNHSRETTLVLITHRLALAEAADQVLFLKNGALVRSGTHETLLQDSAAYGRLWQGART